VWTTAAGSGTGWWRCDTAIALNLLGTYSVTQAFLPLLARSRGAIVNVVSVAAFASLPVMSAYSISKAAAFSL
jgi:short-subunit dehydrogenase